MMYINNFKALTSSCKRRSSLQPTIDVLQIELILMIAVGMMKNFDLAGLKVTVMSPQLQGWVSVTVQWWMDGEMGQWPNGWMEKWMVWFVGRQRECWISSLCCRDWIFLLTTWQVNYCYHRLIDG